MRALVRLSRLEHGAMVAVAVAAGAVAAGGPGSLRSPALAVAAVSAVFVEAALFAFNDLLNLEEDRVNSPERPLVRGDLTARQAVAFGTSCMALGLLLSAMLGPAPLAVVAVASALGMAYNAGLKRYGPLGNLLVSVTSSLPFVYGSVVAVGAVPPIIVLFFTIAAVAHLGREVIKGICDMEGDARVGVRTLALIMGPRAAAAVATALILTSVLLSLLTFPIVRKPLYVALILLTDAILLYSVASLVRGPYPGAAEGARRYTLVGMGVGIAAFAAAGL